MPMNYTAIPLYNLVNFDRSYSQMCLETWRKIQIASYYDTGFDQYPKLFPFHTHQLVLA